MISNIHIDILVIQCTVKVLKLSGTQNACCNHPKIQTQRSFHREFFPKAADGMTNSEDPDPTAPLGGLMSGSALFAKVCLHCNI